MVWLFYPVPDLILTFDHDQRIRKVFFEVFLGIAFKNELTLETLFQCCFYSDKYFSQFSTAIENRQKIGQTPGDVPYIM
jgi:hypothetical protein